MPAQEYQIQVNVPESLIEALISRKRKPSITISNIFNRMIKDMTIEEIIDFSERGADFEALRKNKNDFPVEPYNNGRTWTYSTFEDYMNKLVSQAKSRSSVGSLIALLIAYLETTSRPSSEELRLARGFGPGEQWYEELRTSKSRLTIAAKHLSLPSFFLRAYGSGLNRRHPLDEKVYRFLNKWGADNSDLVQEYKKVATPRSAD